jgi:hypothetical protein
MNLNAIHTDNRVFNDIFRRLAGEQVSLSGDAYNSHPIDTMEYIKEALYSEQQARYITAGIEFQTLNEARTDMTTRAVKLMAGDEFFNPANGIGTLSDPAAFTRSNVPVMFGPMEASSMYASGGLAAIIIDKKARGMVGDGVVFKTFDADFWDTKKLKMLEEAAELSGLNENLTECIRDSLLQGGSTLHPIFKGDRASNLEKKLEDMNLEPGCIQRWVLADRWNIVYVPSFIITAEDYLRPKTIYLPLGGYAVSTTRCLLLRPKTMPYWAMLYNIGWSPSDYSGYIRSLLGYIIMAMSLPIMAQQMSLLLYQMPLDALQGAIGSDNVKKLMDINSENMRNWSMLNPQAVNLVGELKVVERTFSGFDQFIEAAKGDLAANCGISQPILFYTQNKGFSDNTQQALLKESETMKMLQRQIETQLPNLTDALVAHVWGTGSKEWDERRKVEMSFDRPMVSTEKDLAEVGARYAATIASLATAGIPPATAVEMAKQFFKGTIITDEMRKEIEEAQEHARKMEEQGIQAKKQKGPGPSMASKGNAGSTGHFTKPV